MSSHTERANAIRVLAMDAVQKANSGHPGAPMGLADIAEVLFTEVLRHNPENPHWIDRDRFVLSNGHASMLLYACLYLSGYDVSIEDIRNFRQLGSITAGHPEFGHCPGVETTTGPLGQGIANAVGMAIAERSLAVEFNRPDHDLVDHHTWVIAGDGCLMEGVSHEAASLAGTLGLGKLNLIYDDNGISIDGPTEGWFSEDVATRFEAYGWQVIRNVDGHDSAEVRDALISARNQQEKPSLICCRTIIGFGAPHLQGSEKTHGAPLGEEEVSATRKNLNWGYPPFEIPEEILADWSCRGAGQDREAAWNERFDAYAGDYPELAQHLVQRMQGQLPKDWAESLQAYIQTQQENPSNLATRISSQHCLDRLGRCVPGLLGGSADLTGSNGTRFETARTLTGSENGNYIEYGVREFGMTAIGNGLALHGGFIPYSGTFLVFMEYARNAVRMAALMGVRNILVYTHDSVALGEDGPTHQPVEQLTNLRTTPNLSTWRPCDTVETAVAWQAALQREDGPSALILTRQKTEAQVRDDVTLSRVSRGGYILKREPGALQGILIATGSEVALAVKAAQQLAQQGYSLRVVSMPSTDVYLAQDDAYQEEVLPREVTLRVAVEAAYPDYWYRFVGLDGAVVGIDRFGLSAPGDEVLKALGITLEHVVDTTLELLQAASAEDAP